MFKSRSGIFNEGLSISVSLRSYHSILPLCCLSQLWLAGVTTFSRKLIVIYRYTYHVFRSTSPKEPRRSPQQPVPTDDNDDSEDETGKLTHNSQVPTVDGIDNHDEFTR